jgi:hypothetical protein
LHPERLGNTAGAFGVSSAPRTLRQPQDRAQLAAHLDPQLALPGRQADRLHQAPHHRAVTGRTSVEIWLAGDAAPGTAILLSGRTGGLSAASSVL